MLITLKYKSICAVCDGEMDQGEQAEWEKKSGVGHPSCVNRLSTQSESKPSSHTSKRLAELRAKMQKERKEISEKRLKEIQSAKKDS